MRKYMDADVVAALGSVMEIGTEHYKSDFRYDIEMFNEAAMKPNSENTRLIWLSRPSGTSCFFERNAYIKDANAYRSLCYNATTNDNILAYAVEVTGLKGGRVKGNLYELDFRKYAARLADSALPAETVKLNFADGTIQRIPALEFVVLKYEMSKGNSVHGDIASLRYEPKNESDLRRLLGKDHLERQGYTPAKFKVGIRNEKRSIKEQLAPVKWQPAQREPPEQDAENFFEIYQLKDIAETMEIRFLSFDDLRSADIPVDRGNYDFVYRAPLAADMTLDGIFEQFNVDHPADFTGHSLSVSDVVVLHQGDESRAHYVDSIGFAEAGSFLDTEKPSIKKQIESAKEQKAAALQGKAAKPKVKSSEMEV